MKMQKTQRGFTLIELVTTTVLLGVLSAVAIPKYMDLKGDASQASVKGVADTLAAAANANYASRSVGVSSSNIATVAASSGSTAAASCNSIAPQLIASGSLPTGYTVDDVTALVAGDNTCTLKLVTDTNTAHDKTATFGVFGII